MATGRPMPVKRKIKGIAPDPGMSDHWSVLPTTLVSTYKSVKSVLYSQKNVLSKMIHYTIN